MTRASRTVWWLPLAGFPLMKWFVGPGVTIADAMLAGPAAMRLLRERPRDLWATVPLPFRLFGFFWLWALLAGLWAGHASPLPFSAIELLKSQLKLTFYLATASLMVSQVVANGVDRTSAVLRRVLMAHSFLVVALYTATWATPGLVRSLPLPGGEHVSLYYHLRWLGDSTAMNLAFPRESGLLGEPSTLAIVHTLGLAFLLLAPRQAPRLGAGHLLILLSILLTFSLTGYGLLLVTVSLALWRWRHELVGWHLRPRRPLVACSVMVGVLLIPQVRSTFEYSVTRRVAHAAGGFMDFSARARLVENWRVAGRMAERAWLTGVGIGNYDVALEGLREDLPLQQLSPPGSQGWNILAYCLATTGLPGLLLFLLPIATLARGHPTLGTLLFASLFAHVGVLEPVFWIPFALFVAAAQCQGSRWPAGAPRDQGGGPRPLD